MIRLTYRFVSGFASTPELRAAEDLPEKTEQRTESRWILHADLERALDELPEHHREVIELRYFEGMEEPEIAKTAGIPRGTVKSRLHRARMALRDKLKPMFEQA